MDRLTAEDRIMLLGDETWPQDIGALAILEVGPLLDPDGQLRLETVKQAVAGRLHLLPRFRQLLLRPPPGLGGPVWGDAPDFSLDDHVRVAAVPPPGDDDQLLRTVERLRRRRLDPSRPLWELWLLTGLPDERLGLYVRIHHVIADGMAGVATLATLLDANPATPPGPPRPWTPAPAPTKRDLLTDNLQHQARRLGRTLHALTHPLRTLRRLSAIWPTIHWMLTAKAGPATSLNRIVGPGRTLALIRTDLDQVRQVAHEHGATVNDALLAITAGGLRGLLRHRAEPLDGLVLPIYVPHTLRRAASDQSTGNLISQMVIPLPVGLADPGQRLRSIATETALRKAQPHPSVGSLFPSWLPGRTIMKFAASRRVNLTTTNLPGPSTPLYFAGAQLIEIFPVLPLIGNVSLGVGAMSYSGQFNLMIVADRDTYPDLDVFTTSAAEELDDLQATGPHGIASTPYPASHIDLLDRPLQGVLTTEMADGRLQSTSALWCPPPWQRANTPSHTA